MNLRPVHVAATMKKTANPPSMNNEVGNPVSSLGIRKIHAPVTSSVSSITIKTGSSAELTMASTIAITSMNNTSGQIKMESAANLNTGINTSNRASAGKALLHHGSGVPRMRCITTGAAEWKSANTK